MLRVVPIIIGVLFVLFILLCCYAALIVAAREDERMEEYDPKQMTKKAEQPTDEEVTKAAPEVSAG